MSDHDELMQRLVELDAKREPWRLEPEKPWWWLFGSGPRCGHYSPSLGLRCSCKADHTGPHGTATTLIGSGEDAYYGWEDSE